MLILKFFERGPREMAQKLRERMAFAEDLSFFPVFTLGCSQLPVTGAPGDPASSSSLHIYLHLDSETHK